MFSNVITYVANDARCQYAIEDLNSGMGTLTWKEQYRELYFNITYEPEGFPIVVDCNYSEKHYQYIQEFANLFIFKFNEHEDPFNNPPENSED